MRPTVHPNLVDTNAVYHASGSWRLRMNIADLELGRDTVYGKTLAIRYFTGLRGAWLFQDFDVLYQWHADDINQSWDGMYQGHIVQDDVYVWKIIAYDTNGDEHELYGHVTVIK